VIALLVDANLDGHAKLIRGRMRLDPWREFADALQVQFVHFKDIGLERTAPDDAVWRLCQARGYYLLTANRNRESPDSLEATIRREGTLDSLPAFTLADAERLYRSTVYLDKVVEKLLDHLLNIENLRGTGRLYLP
jgi:hypothetical protein